MGRRRNKIMKGSTKQKSEYGLQLAEKQTIKRDYGLRERQFKNYFEKGKNPEAIFSALESRLDSIILRSGIAFTRSMARQIVGHGHVLVNGRKINIPSARVKAGDVVSIRESSKGKGVFADYEMRIKKYEPSLWISLDKQKMQIKLLHTPSIKDQVQPYNFQTVVEFYSR